MEKPQEFELEPLNIDTQNILNAKNEAEDEDNE